MPLTMRPETAFVFLHGQTWDYVCRACLKNGETIEMKVYQNSQGVWIECPKCGAKENIARRDISLRLDEQKICGTTKKLRFITWLIRKSCPYRKGNKCDYWFGICLHEIRYKHGEFA